MAVGKQELVASAETEVVVASLEAELTIAGRPSNPAARITIVAARHTGELRHTEKVIASANSIVTIKN